MNDENRLAPAPELPRASLPGAAAAVGASLLEDIRAFLCRFIRVQPLAVDVLACWVLHTHAIEAADSTPYIHAGSPEPRCGKSRLLETLALVVRDPLPTASATTPAIFRSLLARVRTLLLDEVDALFRPPGRGGIDGAEDMRALLNAGNRRGTPCLRCVGPRHEVIEFPTFGPKALAGIGSLPGTLDDRALRIRLRRTLPHERPERLIGDEPRATGEALRARAASWAEGHLDELRQARPEIPEQLDDRAADACLPLFAIADLAGGRWDARVRAGVLELREPESQVDSDGIALLSAVRRAFATASEHSQLSTLELLEHLAADLEAPDGFDADDRGRPRRLAKLLRPFGIHSEDLHDDRGPARRTVKGYRLARFGDPFGRYLPPDPGDPSTPSAPPRLESGFAASPNPRHDGGWRGLANGGNQYERCDGADGADSRAVPVGEAPNVR
jgi:hypothetical protein